MSAVEALAQVTPEEESQWVVVEALRALEWRVWSALSNVLVMDNAPKMSLTEKLAEVLAAEGAQVLAES